MAKKNPIFKIEISTKKKRKVLKIKGKGDNLYKTKTYFNSNLTIKLLLLLYANSKRNWALICLFLAIN